METRNSTPLYSNAFNFLSNLNTGVDPRTGTFSCSVSLPEMQANDLNGPFIPIALTFNAMQSDDRGLGVGWSFGLSSFHAPSSTLTLFTGDTYKAVDTGTELFVKDKKLNTFTVAKQEETGDFVVVHKSGIVEILSNLNGFYSSALPSRVISPEGWSVYFDYDFYDGERYLSELRDETRRLLTIKRERGEVLISQFPDNSDPTVYKLKLVDYGIGLAVEEIQLPLEDQSSWKLEYEPLGAGYVISKVHSPMGGTEVVHHSPPGEGHRSPPGGPDYLPYVVSHEIYPGNDQAVLRKDYRYSSHNFLGYGVLNSWTDAGDNLYLVQGVYEYSSTESLYSDNQPVGDIIRTYNRFHLQTEEAITYLGKTVRTLTTYGDDPELPWEDQKAWCQLPVKVVTQHDDGERLPRESFTETSYDDYGNTLTQRHPDGRIEKWDYYPVGGGDGCPDDGTGFERWLKSHTLEPARLPDGGTGGALSTRTEYRYERLPSRPSHDHPHLVVVSETAVAIAGAAISPLGNTTQRYQTDVNSPHYGLVVQTVTTLNGLPTTTEYARTLVGTHLTVETTVTGHDDTSTIESTTRDSLTGLTKRERNVNGVETTYDYDRLGRVVNRTQAPGTPYQTSAACRYVTVGRERLQSVMVEETDITGQQRRIYLDGVGRRIREERRDTDITGEIFREVWRGTYHYDGQLATETTRDWQAGQSTPLCEVTTRHRFDAWRQLSEVVRADGVTEHTQSDPVTLTTLLWQNGTDGKSAAQTEVIRNVAGDVIKVTVTSPTREVLRIEEWAHDGLSRPIMHRVTVPGTDPVETRTGYDAYGRVLRRVLADGSEVNWDYAAHSDDDHPVSVTLTPPGGRPLLLGQQTFDGLGRQLTSSAGGQHNQLRYIKGQVPPVSRESASGRMQTYRYEPLLNNRLVGLTQNDGSSESTYSYHPRLTQLVEAQGGLGQLAWTYSASGRLTAEHWTVDGKRNTVTWQNSLGGLLLTFTDVNGVAHRTEYDALGRPDQQQADPVTMRITYDAFGRVSRMVTEDAVGSQSLDQTLKYDAFGREVSRVWLSISPTRRRQVTQTLDWTNRDQVARRRWEADGQLLSEESYQYDRRGRLTESTASGPEGPIDPRTGKRISKQTFIFNALDGYEQVVTVYTDGARNEMTFTYDAVAPDRPVKIRHSYPTRQDFTLEYDADGRLIRDGQGRELHWNADGQLSRVSREDQECGYQYDPMGRLSEVRPNGIAKRRYYQGEYVVNEQCSDETVTLLRTGSAMFAQTRISQAVREVLLTGSDGQGTVRLEAGTDARLVSYTAHGADDGEASSLIGYAGESRDAISGCYLPGSYRPYDPELMMFLAPDSESPFGSGGLNRYAYCAGDPVNRIDPDGHSFWKWLIAGVGIALGALGTIASLGAAAPALAGGIAALTVSGALSVASATLGAVSLTTGVASMILEATGNESAAGILGWISLGTGIASAVTGLAPAAGKAVDKFGKFVGRWQHKLQHAGGVPGTPATSTAASVGKGTLPNTKLKLLDVEDNLAGWAQRNGEATITHVKKASDLSILNDTSRSHKFIFNQDGNLTIGSVSKSVDPKMLSHPTLAASSGNGEVISAGYLHRSGDVVSIVNHSGHYRPDFSRLRPVSNYIRREFGLKTRLVEAESLGHGWLKLFR
ncbi:RHS repeat domain-containing protein [Burkholderia ubonensis]|uniref:RHS repeat domain-containing protein n=1 Tax=Burkholderia ubonensis TaxID=101571 RepID=UPI0009B4336F|nr:RHS repeat-associated core domain-containing protein [Burkholderia ubonensis]